MVVRLFLAMRAGRGLRVLHKKPGVPGLLVGLLPFPIAGEWFSNRAGPPGPVPT